MSTESPSLNPGTLHLSKHLRELYFGENWTGVCIRELVSDLNVSEAQHRRGDCHSIAELLYHLHYFVAAALRVLSGRELAASDAESFKCPMFVSDSQWQAYVEQCMRDAEQCAELLQHVDDAQLWSVWVNERYGNHYKNLQGTLEHAYYHLGQISILKKQLRYSTRS